MWESELPVCFIALDCQNFIMCFLQTTFSSITTMQESKSGNEHPDFSAVESSELLRWCQLTQCWPCRERPRGDPGWHLIVSSASFDPEQFSVLSDFHDLDVCEDYRPFCGMFLNLDLSDVSSWLDSGFASLAGISQKSQYLSFSKISFTFYFLFP